MERQLDLSKEYGLVLEGGGAKGAYQIGAWQALREEGVKIKGISGVSVGALNGALICMDDLDKAREIWENISYSQVMTVGIEKKVYSFRLEDSLVEDLQKYAKQQNRKLSNLVETILKQYVAEEKRKEAQE